MAMRRVATYSAAAHRTCVIIGSCTTFRELLKCTVLHSDTCRLPRAACFLPLSSRVPPAQTPIVGLNLPSLPGFPPPLSVGNVYQRFSSVESGVVENIIELGVPPFLEADKGVTFTVKARSALCGGGCWCVEHLTCRLQQSGSNSLLPPCLLNWPTY